MTTIINTHEPSSWQKNKSRVIELKSNRVEDLNGVRQMRNQFGTVSLPGNIHSFFRELGNANLYSTASLIYNYLYYANQLNYAWFQYTLHSGQSVKFMIVDKEVETIGQFSTDSIGTFHVMKAIQTALILRDKQALDFYAQIPLSFTEQAPQEDMLFETMFLFYQVLLSGKDTTSEAQATYNHLAQMLTWEEYKQYVMIEGFNDESVWKLIFEMRKQTTESIFLPVLHIYHHVLQRNQAGFEKAVEEALYRWKAYYSLQFTDVDGEEYDHTLDPTGYLSLPILAACAYAFDRGMRLINLESKYIPQWLIAGNVEEMELLVND